MMLSGLIGILVPLVILAVFAYIVWFIIQQIPMLQPFKTVILALFSLVVFLYLLQLLGLYKFA